MIKTFFKQSFGKINLSNSFKINKKLVLINMANQGEVTTLVDELFGLVKERGEISIDEAAKILKTNPKVVEQWALFLEEDNLITINYGLSSPLLRYVGKSSSESQPVQSKTEESSKRINKGLISSEKEKSTSERGIDIIAMLKDIEGIIKNSKSLDSATASEILSQLEEISSYIDSVYADSDAKKKILSAYQIIRKVLENFATGKISAMKAKVAKNTTLKNLKEMQTQILSLIDIEEQKRLTDVEKNLPSEGTGSEIFSEIKYLIEQSKELARKGDLDKARQMYKRISELRAQIPAIYYKKNVEVVDDIVDFDRQLAQNLMKKSEEEFNSKEKQIMILISEAKSYAGRGKISFAEDSLRKATKLFNELPSGFLKRKSELQSKMLRTKARLLQTKRDIETKKFSMTEDKLNAIKKKIDSLLAKKEIKEAKNLLDLANKLIDTISNDFYIEKKRIRGEFIQISHKIDTISEQIHRETFAEGMSNLNSQINIIEKAINSKNTALAIKSYLEAVSLFKKLPEGFLKDKIPVQERLLEDYSKINELILQDKIKNFSSSFNKIKDLIEQANENINKKELKKAQEIYEEILRLYDQLPGGFLEKKTMLRLQILNLYDKLREEYEEVNKSILSSLNLFPNESLKNVENNQVNKKE